MEGILHIFRVGEQRDRYGQLIPGYQLNYDVESGNTYARTFDGREALSEFLADKALVPEATLEQTLHELDSTGHITIPGVEIPEKDAAAIGLEELPSDF